MSYRNYYDTSTYGRSRDTSRTNKPSLSTERPTSVTAKYINTTPSYKSSSIPIISSERSSTKDESPISTIANRYANYNKTEKPTSKFEKKDYSKLIPTISTTRDKSRDVSPVSTASKYSLSRPSRRLSPERKTGKSFKEKIQDSSLGDRDKNIPSKTDKSSSYNSLTSYKLYPRTPNYSKPSTKTEAKPEITVNRYAIANRLSNSYLRSPPTVKRTSVSPVNHNDNLKNEPEKSKIVSPTILIEEIKEPCNESVTEKNDENNKNETETVVVITRHTSPTPPGSSAYVRSRRADMAKTIEKTITRKKSRPDMLDKEVQSDRLDDSTRLSRFGSTARTSTTNWSYYSPNVSSYTGYAGRYSTQYSTLRDNSNMNIPSDRSSRSHSTEPPPKENIQSSISCNNSGSNLNQEIVTEYAQNTNNDTSEIIINVNLKLKRAKSPPSTTELVSPEITITNNTLPPQAPKTENSTKLKRPKIRKSSIESSTDSSSKKKVLKKRSKSVSSTDSDQGSEAADKTSSKSKSIKKTSSSSNLQNSFTKLKHSKSRESDSPESTITLSTQSSISEDDNDTKSKSNDLSRTTADEVSIPTDKSAKNSSIVASQKNDTGTEEAKSFLIRALAPVTNLFKIRHSESSDTNRCPDSSITDSTSNDVSNFLTESEKSSKNKNIIPTNDDNLVKLTSIRRIESGEGEWTSGADGEKINNSVSSLNQISLSDKDVPKLVKRTESGDKSCWSEINSDNKMDSSSPQYMSENLNSSKPVRQRKYIEEEKPWWLDSCANIPEGIERLTPPRKSSSDSDKSEKFNFFKIRHIESGDQKDWWLTSNENSSFSNKQESQNVSRSGSERNFPLRRIRHIESGERPWWLSSEKNIPEGIEKLPTPPPQESDSSDSEEVQEYVPRSHVPPFPLNLPDDEPLGDRRSPEGLETPKENEYFGGRTSPYENNRQYRRGSGNSYTKGMKNFISRCTDIDDILGMSGQIYSPFMDSILAKRTGRMAFDDAECEEIDATQVRIHDSTPQRPVIKKIRSRSNIIDYREEDQLDDATLQVFKDGDYGPYLDLDSTLGEQDEELEGLQDNRKNALVLRTQLPVRVNAIIEQLLHAQGRELRRALFSLKQILQSDKDLVHEFVANKGLDCLMKVGNMADHNYLDYILRALGQILLYVDGMHGVMAHKHCVQWLYSLISSKYRHVVKTALKLLLVFVEYTEDNCVLLINAINQADTSNGHPPWHNIMKILQDFDASDIELLIYATTLINRCLNNVPDRNSYYDQIDSLNDQGIEEIVQLYTSKQGTDLDLLRQFQIFESVLLYEDGEEAIALTQLDESVMKLIRRRRLNLNSADRRYSKKHQLKSKESNSRYTTNLMQRMQNGTLGHSVNATDTLNVILKKKMDCAPETKDDHNILPNRPTTHNLAQRLSNSPSCNLEDKHHRVTEMAGIVLKAKEGLAKSQSKDIIKNASPSPLEISPKTPDLKLSENDLNWEKIKKNCMKKTYYLCDLDFTELQDDSDDEIILPSLHMQNNIPPPPPTMFPPFKIPPPPPKGQFTIKGNVPAPPPKPTFISNSKVKDTTINKNKKTVKLFWREITDNPAPMNTAGKGLIWDNLPEVSFDKAMLEHLFEAKSNDLLIKEKFHEPKRNLILDTKRSNAINIAMKKLPTAQTIKAAIIKMDATVIGREGIEKLLTMLPTDEEKVKMQEAQYANPNLPLGSAEQFLLTLASINELTSRLKLWVFKLDFDNTEREIAEPLMDLKQGLELLKVNKTFKVILSTLREVGSFLNGTHVKGFRLEYLSKVTEVKDTVHKHPLLYHICEIIIEKFPDSTDLFSEVGPVIRASKVDFDALSSNLQKLESDCKASWEHMQRIAKHDASPIFKAKINEFLIDAAERIILLTQVKNKIMNRYTKFLLYLGVPFVDLHRTKPSEFLKLIAEFALEYRTTRERVLQQLEKKANHRERNKTRGKLIIDVGNYSNKTVEPTADSALKELLKSDPDTDSLTERRRKMRRSKNFINGDLSPDDEIIESLVRTTTEKPKVARREMRKNRLSQNKNWNRTLDGQQPWLGQQNTDKSISEGQQ